MAGHDIVVIGTSAGGLKALTTIVGQLPSDLAASLFVVQHLQPDYATLLPQILSDTGALGATLARDGEKIRQGVIYVSPSDHHMLISGDAIRIVHGPRENNFRPSIDALFRSAARCCGSRVVGVVLSGLLDDGTIGLQAIKKRGGIAVVQDPREAEFSHMPGNALRYAQVDHCLSLLEIAKFIAHAPTIPVMAQPSAVDVEMEAEVKIAEQEMNTEQLIENVDAIGSRTVFTCPACHGTLWQIGTKEPLYFRCHAGHAFTANALVEEQTRSLENSLWSAVRLMEEKVEFARRMAERRRNAGLTSSAEEFETYANNLDREVDVIRSLILHGLATQAPALVVGEP